MSPKFFHWAVHCCLCLLSLPLTAQSEENCDPVDGRPVAKTTVTISYGATAGARDRDRTTESTLLLGQPTIGAGYGDEVRTDLGFYARFLLPPAAPYVRATQGEFPDRIQVSWKTDLLSTQSTDGYVVQRDGAFLAEVDAQTTTYIDFNVQAGERYTYTIIGRNDFGRGLPGDDVGFTNPNGVVTGQITTRTGNPVAGAYVTLEPTVGTSLAFDGVDDYVCLTYDSTLASPQFTVSTYVKLASNDAAGTLLDRGKDLNANYWLQTIGGGQAGVVFGIGNGSGATELTIPFDSLPGAWHHVAFVYNGSAVVGYLDGEYAGAMRGGLSTARALFHLGNSRAEDAYFYGSIDDLRIYDLALSQTEILQGKDLAASPNTPGLRAYWKFDEGIGRKVFDIAGRDIDGELENGATFSSDAAPILNAGVTDAGGFYTIQGVNYADAPTLTARPQKFFYDHASLEFSAANESRVDLPGFDLPDTATIEVALQPFEVESKQTILAQAGGAVSVYINEGQIWLATGSGTAALGPATTQMQHWALRMDALAGRTEFYRNGNLSNTVNLAHRPGVVDSTGWWLGTRSGEPVEALTGIIDEVAVFDTLLTNALLEIHASPLAAEGIQSGISAGNGNLVAFFPLDEGSQNLVEDYGPNMLGFGTVYDAVWSVSAYRQVRTPHLFRPSERVVNLNSSSTAVGDIDFVDESTVPVSGVIRFSDTYCYQDSVQILVNGSPAVPPVFSDASGRWVIDLEPGADVRLSPHYPDTTHMFLPGTFRARRIQRPISGVLFQNTTKRTVEGIIAGGECQNYLNVPGADLRVKIESLNGCWSETQRVPDQSTAYRFTNVPPLPVVVKVIRLSPQTILDRLQVGGGTETDLRQRSADTINFIYTAPPNVEVQPFATDDCGLAYIQSSTLRNFAARYSTEVRVYENYPGGRCYLRDSFQLRINNQIADAAPIDTLVRDTDVYVHTYPAGIPNFNGDRTKFIEVTATVDSVDSQPGLQRVTVLGRRSRGGSFLTTSPTWPLMVLRDPPGDGSSATFTENTQHCSVLLQGSTLSIEGGTVFELDGSPETTVSTGIGVETTTTVEAGADVVTTIEKSLSYEQGLELQWCTSFNRSFSTSAGDDLLHGDADLFFGIAANVLMGRDDILFLDEDQCQFADSSKLRVDLDAFDTEYIFSKWQLETEVIPELLESPLERDQEAAASWREFIEANERDKEEAELIRNYSFDGLTTVTETSSASFSTAHTHNFTANISAAQAATLGFEVNDAGAKATVSLKLGGGASIGGGETEEEGTTTEFTLADDDPNDKFSVNIKQGGRWNTPVFELVSGESMCPWEPGTSTREKVGFNVDRLTINNVPENGQAVYRLFLDNDGETGVDPIEYIIGQVVGSNPDGAVLRIDGASIANPRTYHLLPNESIELTLTVNRGPRAYDYENLGIFMASKCMFEHAATLYDISNTQYTIDPETGDTLTREGPFDREDLANFYKEYRLNVSFTEPCTPIDISFPRQDWVVTPDDNSLLGITLTDYFADDPDLDTVRIQYRPVGGDGAWINVVELPRDSFADHPVFRSELWNMEELRDGPYEIRAVAACRNPGLEPGISEVIQGRKETRPPALLGTPEPADGILSPGDEISITFTKRIDCGRIFPADGIGTNININNLALIDQTTGELIDATISCREDKIVIVPNVSNRFIENRFLKVVTQGILDFYGNESERIEWEFFVNRSNLYWADGRIDETVLEGNALTVTRELRNQSGQITSYTIPNVPPWMNVFPRAGSLAPGERQRVTFEFPADLLADAYSTDLVLETVDGEEPLKVDLRVTCEGPNWHIDPAAYNFSTNLTVELDIEGVLSDDRVDRIGAFVDGELRGVANIARYDAIGSSDLINPYLAFLTVYSNVSAGDTIDFQVWDASACKLYGTTVESFTFSADNVLGEPLLPLTIHTTGELLKTIQLKPGWNWISYNLDLGDPRVNNTLASLSVANEHSVMKKQGQFANYVPSLNQWFGSLRQTDVRSMYQLRVPAKDSLILIGTAVDVEQDIPVVAGWNWIGFLPDRGLPVGTALQSLVPLNGDVVKSQTAFSQYVAGVGWVGNLRFMNTPNGYLLRLSQPGTLRFPAPDAPGLRTATAPVSEQLMLGKSLSDTLPRHWTVDAARYEHSMNVVAVVAEGREELLREGDEVAAFVGDELRGADRVVYIPELDRYYAFLTVFADEEGETVTYRLFDQDEEEEIALPETTDFTINRVLGNVTEPFVFQLGTTSVEPDALDIPAGLIVYPNPAAGKVYVAFDARAGEDYRILVRDLVGRVVARVNGVAPTRENTVEWDAAGMPDGIYLLTLERDGYRATTKIQLTR